MLFGLRDACFKLKTYSKAAWVGELHDKMYHQLVEKVVRNDKLKKEIMKYCTERCLVEFEVFHEKDIQELVEKLAEKYKHLRNKSLEIKF